MAAVLDRGPYAPEDKNRTFAFAVVASILVHALILLAVPVVLEPLRNQRLSVPPVTARLVQSRPAPAPAPAPEPTPEPRVEEAPRPARKPTQVTSAQPASAPPVAFTAPVPQVAPVIDAPRAAEPTQPAPAAAVSAPPSARLAPASPAPAAASAAGEAADPLTLGQYRIAIITAAKRYKKYPRLAMDNNWEGKAEIRMVIGADGGIASISIRSRSGFEILDQQALEMIRKAKPLAPIPAALRGRGFTVDVPVEFSLKDETG